MKVMYAFMFDRPQRAGTKFDLIGQLNVTCDSSVIPGGQQVVIWNDMISKKPSSGILPADSLDGADLNLR